MAMLQDGRVLIAGGMVENGVFLSSAELFDPATGRFSTTDNMQSRRVGHSATLLLNGTVLIAGVLAGRVFEGGIPAGSLPLVAFGQPLGVFIDNR